MKHSPIHYLKVSLGCFAIGAYAATFIGCTTPKTFHQVIKIPATEIHIVSDRSQFDYIPYRDRATGVYGYAWPDKIFIHGGMTEDGQVYITDMGSLGHELVELMRLNQKEDVLNPHEYKFWMK